MRSGRYGLALLFCLASVFLPAKTSGATRAVRQIAIDGKTVEVAAGEVVVKFRRAASAERRNAMIASLGVSSDGPAARQLASHGFVRIRLKKLDMLEDTLQALRSSADVEYAEPNFVYRLQQNAGPDPLLPEQWGLPAMGVPEAWARATGKQISVAVIDSGVVLDHPDLAGRLQPGYDFVDGDDRPEDAIGHGTMCAGIIAANQGDGIGISGIAPHATIVPLRAVDAGGVATATDLAAAVLWAADKGVQVINLSLGGPDRSQVLEEAIRAAIAQGIVVCASAGNTGEERELYPAAYAGVVGVGASTREGRVWPLSNTGAAVDFAAPGVDIVSTTLTGHGSSSGSSLATAAFSGAVALVLSSRNDMTAVEAVGRLGATAADIGDPGFDPASGHGIPNVGAAIALEVPDFVDVAVSSIAMETHRVQRDAQPRLSVMLANRGRTKLVLADVVITVNGEEVARRERVIVRHETTLQFDLVPPADGTSYEITAKVTAAEDGNAANDSAKLELSVLPDEDASYVILYKNRPFVHTWVAYQAMQILPSGALKTELTSNFWDDTPYEALFIYPEPYSPPPVPSSWSSSRSSGTSVAEGTWEEDEDEYGLAPGADAPLQHFWNPDNGYDNGLSASVCGLGGSWHSALYTARIWWDKAVQDYANGQTASAYYALGRVTHLLGDMGVPEHVHNDPHPGDAVGAIASICTDYDDFSNYEEITSIDYLGWVGLGPPKVISNLPLQVPSGYAPTSYNASLVRLFYNQAQYTQHSDSSDNSGNSVGYGGGSISMGISADGGSKNQEFAAIGYLKGAPNQDRMDLHYTHTVRWCDFGFTGCTWRSLSEGGSSGNYYHLARAYGQVEPSSSLWTSMNNTLDYLEVTYRYKGIVKTDNISNFRDSQTYTVVPDRYIELDRLFRENIRYIAGLYQLFWDTTHPPVTVTASDSIATESGPTTGQFTIARTGSTTSSLSVNVTMSGTATAGGDYNTISSPVTIPTGSSSVNVTVTPINDSTVESDETVTLTISSSSAYTVGSPSAATVTIQSDDVSTVTISATDSTATEAGPTTGQFTITRSGGSTSSALSVSVSTGGSATSGSDYNAISSPVTIPAGSSSATVTVTPVNDSSVESDETVTLTINSGSGYTVGSPGTATVTITSDDVAATTVSVSVSDSTATEAGTTTGRFTVSRSGGSTSSSLSVNVSFGGSAGNGSDYSTLSSPVVIPSGSSSVNVTVTPINDSLVESDETVTLTVQSGSGYSVGSPSSGTVTITSDDVASTTVTISANDPTATESGPTTGQFTVTRSGGSFASSLQVNLTIAGTATNGSDYNSLSSSVTIPANASSTTITVTPVNDSAVESDESVTISIDSGGGYSIGSPAQATVIITSDESGGGGSPHPFIEVTGAEVQVHDLGAGSDGTVYVLFAQSDPKELFVVKSTDGGESWQQPVAIPDSDHSNSDFRMDVDSTGTIHVVWSGSIGDDQVYYSRSTNGGASFSVPVDVRSGNSYSGYSTKNGTDPVVASDGAGNVYVAFGAYTMNSSGTFLGYNVWVSTSTNGGSSFQPEVPINAISSAQKKPRRIRAGASGFYVLYLDESNDDLYFHRSTAGALAGNPQVNSHAGAVDFSGDFVAGPGETAFYAVYSDTFNDSEGNITFCKSTDGGDSWSSCRTVNDNTYRHQDSPRIEIDSAGRLHVAWNDMRGDEYQTYYAYSTDGGEVFSTNVDVSDPFTTFRFTQTRVAVDDSSASVYFSATREISQVMVARRSTNVQPPTDLTAPAGTISVNSGATHTNSTSVTLTLNATDAVGVTGYFTSNSSINPSAGQAGWVSVASTTSFSGVVNNWQIGPGEGPDSVYVWFKDAAGNISPRRSDAITLDQTPPTNPALTATPGPGNVQLTWTGETDALSGVASAKLVFAAGSTPPANCSGATLATGSPYTHTGLTPGQPYSYRVCITDNAGNSSSGATATATPQQGGGSRIRNDVNGDGRADIFWRNTSTGQTSVWFMNGTSYSSAGLGPSALPPWNPAVAGDFDGDGRTDFFWHHATTGTTALWLGWNGSAFATLAPGLTIPVAWLPVAAGDIDGDGKADIFWRNGTTGETSIWFMNGAAYSSAIRSTTVPAPWYPAVTGDFDGDGRMDIFWRSLTTGETSLWMGWNGTAFSVQVRSITTGTVWVPVGAGDVSGDGKDDIFWRNTATGQTSLWVMNGAAAPSFVVMTTVPTNWGSVAFGDYDGDGHSDVFWRSATTGETSIWIGFNGTVFTTQVRGMTVPTAWVPFHSR